MTADRLRGLEEDPLLDGLGRVQGVAALGKAVRVRVRHVAAAGRERLEWGAQAGHPGGREGAQRRPVVGDVARDELGALAVAAQAVVVAGELERRLDGLAAARGEEDAVEVAWRERGDPRRQLDGARVRVAPVRVKGELTSLGGGGVTELGAPVARVDAEERREPVQVALAVLVVDVAALAANDDRHLAVLAVGAHPREVHPQVAPGLLLKGARRSLRRRWVGELDAGRHLGSPPLSARAGTGDHSTASPP